jgi:N6-adenosine-specific RNA methylase IME4
MIQSSENRDKIFLTFLHLRKWRKVEKSGKLTHFGKCDKVGVPSRPVASGNHVTVLAHGMLKSVSKLFQSLLTLVSHLTTIHQCSPPELYLPLGPENNFYFPLFTSIIYGK